ncbi:MAG: DUF2853 family protein [Hyphomonadaceae bacterium]
MSKRDALIEKYTEHLTEKVKVKVDKALLLAVTKACGPSIYNKDSATVAASSKSELETVKKSFLIKKLGLKDGPKLDEGLAAVMKQYGSGVRNKYRAVVYYLLVKHFRKGGVFK